VRFREVGSKNWQEILARPVDEDLRDPQRLTQTHIQQLTVNRDFRKLADFFSSLLYVHLVPQLVREGQTAPASAIGQDPLGRDLLVRMRATPKRVRQARLNRIQNILAIAAPQFKELTLRESDETGRPHLEMKFEHWRGTATYQNEGQFSDGTLRLIAILWSLQEKGGPLLLEEPEWSLHSAILSRMAPFISKAQRATGNRQVIISTHSEALLSDTGIGPEEILLLQPTKEGSSVIVGADKSEIRALMQAGIPASQAALPYTQSPQIGLFDKVSL
jgi:predicted ATPase